MTTQPTRPLARGDRVRHIGSSSSARGVVMGRNQRRAGYWLVEWTLPDRPPWTASHAARDLIILEDPAP